jgi:gamma-tubulin complex component 2
MDSNNSTSDALRAARAAAARRSLAAAAAASRSSSSSNTALLRNAAVGGSPSFRSGSGSKAVTKDDNNNISNNAATTALATTQELSERFHQLQQNMQQLSPIGSKKAAEQIQQQALSLKENANNDSNDNHYYHGGANVDSSNHRPKTPLTMMRSVMNSISRDRTDIEEARRLYFDHHGGPTDTTGVVGTRNDVAAAPENDDDGAEQNVNVVNNDDHGVVSIKLNGRHIYTLDETNSEEEQQEQQQHLQQQQHRQLFGSTYLHYGSQVIIKFRNPKMSASISIQPPTSLRSSSFDGGLEARSSPLDSRVCFVVHEGLEDGIGGGGGRYGDNIFVVLKDSGSSTLASQLKEESSGDDEGKEKVEEDEEEDPFADILCYGDTITLRSDVMRRVLGVQKEKIQTRKNDNNGEEATAFSYRLDVGCFRRQGRYPQADQWTVLRGGASAPIVQLGHSITSSSSSSSEKKKRIPVYSGDPIVLRNDWSGGILSVGGEFNHAFAKGGGKDVSGADGVGGGTGVAGWALDVITSSYQMNDGTASTDDNKPLIELLHEHNQCRPRKTETFQFVAANTPHTPDWVYFTAEGVDRVFLIGSYLSEQSRHKLSLKMEQELFPESRAISESTTHQHLVELPVDIQEKVLLDEIFGAMMGLEGQFIRFHTMEIGEKEEGEEYVEPSCFGFASFSYIGGNLDPSLQNILSRMLPLCSNYVHVNQFVSSCLGVYECGIVTQSLCEAINKLLREYLEFVANLNYLLRKADPHGKNISLSMVYVNSQPSIRTMAVLYQVVSTVRSKKGGELLNALQNLMTLHYTGDAKGSEILSFLLVECAAPYARMMQSWLQRGKVHDPYSEFMIEVTDKRFRDSQVTFHQRMEWTDWCRVQDEHVLDSLYDANDQMSPTRNAMFGDESRTTLNMSARDKAYTTGKYRRAILFCDEGSTILYKEAKVEQTNENDVATLLNPLQLSRCIDHAYHDASDTLLHLLMGRYDLLSSLRFMKKYFLLDQGDFFVNFLDGVEKELQKELPNVLQGRVQNWLSTIMARSLESTPQSSHSTQLASSLRCCFLDKNVRDTLHDMGKGRKSSRSKKSSRTKVLAGFEAIAFEFKNVPFPASLVLSPVQLRSYQLLFRQIFFAKYVERQLVNMWSDHQLLKQMTSLKAACSPTYSLRRRMLHFIQSFVYYMKFEVIEPHWRDLESKLIASKEYCFNRSTQVDSEVATFPRTVDDLLNEHNQFLTRLFTQCLLSNYDLIERASKIMTTCLLFCTQIKFFMESTKVHETLENTRIERSMMRFGKKKKNTDRVAEFRAKREENIQRCSDRILQEYRTENYQHMIKKFDQVFTSHLAEFMKNLNSDFGQRSNSHLTNLFTQLDYNGFVSSSLTNNG